MRLALDQTRPATLLAAAVVALVAAVIAAPLLRSVGPAAPAPYLFEGRYSEDEFLTPSYSAPLDLSFLDLH
jgi:hypothetical protein